MTQRAPVVAVLDVGKTNVKVVAFDEVNRVVAERATPNRRRTDGPYPHEDVDAIWAFALAALAEIQRVADIRAIVVTTHGAAGAVVDDEGLVLPVMDYEWDGTNAVEPAYGEMRPPFGETFSPPMPVGLHWGRQLAWQQEHRAEAFARATALLPYPQYWAWRLTGVASAEVTSLGCHTDLWAPLAARPSTLCDARGWTRLLPPVRKAWDVLGPVRPEVAQLAGLPDGVPVHVGLHDSNASLLPHLASMAAPFTVVSTGTWVIAMGVGAAMTALDPAADMLVNVDATGRPVPTARFMGGREYAAITEGRPDQSTLELAAMLVRLGTMALPCFAPQGGPYAARAGQIVGPSAASGSERAALATLYVALMTDDVLDRLGTRTGPLIVEGSFAANPVYCAILAQLRPGQTVVAAPDTAGTALGASLLARWPLAPVLDTRSRVAPSSIPELEQYRWEWKSRAAAQA